ncbi:oxidase [Chryseobacterium herbae]|uniref:Oxidase n=1 Tax=Chryseobacterium herbae TaxID=2976476 RepID=A0ABT2IYT1_9FLAO|nr:oxidase [Chryseobacterium sp. pc1-10]MCT2563957.1 oxidase [Chryseobacterium sp. pc1-10]
MKDFLFNDDLQISNGDFVIGESDNQHQKHILQAFKGEFKKTPEIGVGIEQILNEDSFIPVMIEAKKMLEYDGMTINNIYFADNDKLVIDGKYKQS